MSRTIRVKVNKDADIKTDIDLDTDDPECHEAGAFIRAAMVALGLADESSLKDIDPPKVAQTTQTPLAKKVKT